MKIAVLGGGNDHFAAAGRFACIATTSGHGGAMRLRSHNIARRTCAFSSSDAGGRHDVQLGDIDKAIRHGFGFRYAVLGLLEFIDWGGGDILYYASRYFESALGSDRYRSPEVISDNPRDGRIGMDGGGFLDYSGLDIDAYREPAPRGNALPAQAFQADRAARAGSGLAEYILQNAFANHRDPIKLDGGAHHWQVEMP